MAKMKIPAGWAAPGSLVVLESGRLAVMGDAGGDVVHVKTGDGWEMISAHDKVTVHLEVPAAAGLLLDILSGEPVDLAPLMVFASKARAMNWWLGALSNARTAEQAAAALEELNSLRPEAAEVWRQMYANRLEVLRLAGEVTGNG